jgi:hypothetical protein
MAHRPTMRAALKVIAQRVAASDDPVLAKALTFAQRCAARAGGRFADPNRARSRKVEGACEHDAIGESQCCHKCGVRLTGA